MGRALGLDVGTVRTGAAISDPTGLIATPIGVWERTGYKSDLAKIREVMREYEVDTIVVGHPLNMDGTRGERAIACENYAEKLKKDVTAEVVMWDERMTTAGAERILIQADVSRKKRKKVVDQMAAQLILSSWLDAKRARRRISEDE